MGDGGVLGEELAMRRVTFEQPAANHAFAAYGLNDAAITPSVLGH